MGFFCTLIVFVRGVLVTYFLVFRCKKFICFGEKMARDPHFTSTRSVQCKGLGVFNKNRRVVVFIRGQDGEPLSVFLFTRRPFLVATRTERY